MTYTQEQYELAQDILRYHGCYGEALNLKKVATTFRLKTTYGEDFFKQLEDLIETLQEDNYDLNFSARAVIELFEEWGVAKPPKAKFTEPEDDEVVIYLSWKDVPARTIVAIKEKDHFIYFYKGEGHHCYMKTVYTWSSCGTNIPVQYEDLELELVALNIERRVLL